MTLDIQQLVRRLRAGGTGMAVARNLGVARIPVARKRDMDTAEDGLEGTLSAHDEMDRRLAARLARDDRPHSSNATEQNRAVIEELRQR